MGTKLTTQNQTKITNSTTNPSGQPPLPDDIYDCAICYDKIQPTNYTLTKCSHYFCKPCLDAWLNINSTCPMCRSSIRVSAPKPTISPSRQTPVPDVRLISESRRRVVERNIMERYMWETYFIASNDLKNQEFQPYFADINKSGYAPANFNANQMTLFD